MLNAFTLTGTPRRPVFREAWHRAGPRVRPAPARRWRAPASTRSPGPHAVGKPSLRAIMSSSVEPELARGCYGLFPKRQADLRTEPAVTDRKRTTARITALRLGGRNVCLASETVHEI